MNQFTLSPKQNATNEFIPLPPSVLIPEQLGADACPWLDEYIEFSRKWSPRSFDGYHEGVGLWVLTTVAARRVGFDFGKCRYTNLFIALVGRTSITAKSSSAQIGKAVLQEAGLDWLLLPDTCTPQKMVNEMSGKILENYKELTNERKDREKQKLAFAGQRGWYYEEFGMLISGMMRSDGVMADFRGHLRRFDDTEERFENGTIGRGNEVIERPYLALLASLTPADIIPYAKFGSTLWGDGFLARFALVSPNGDCIPKGRFPKGKRVIPSSLTTPLQEWHEYLGLPEIEIVGSNAIVNPIGFKSLLLDETVFEACNAYNEVLMDIASASNNCDLDGNYARFAEKALRIAALFASFTKNTIIQMNHWARAQEIVERWRKNLHDLYNQLNESGSQRKPTNEVKVLKAIDNKTSPTKREIEQVTGLNSQLVQDSLDTLLDMKSIKRFEDGRTNRYSRTGQNGFPQDGDRLISIET